MLSNQRETGANSEPQSKTSVLDKIRTDWSQVVRCLALIGILPASIVLTTYFQDGFVSAGRAATALIMPVAMVWLALWAMTVFSATQGRIKWSLTYLGGFLLWACLGNGDVASQAIRWVEMPMPTHEHPAFEKRDKIHRLDALVTLGGSAGLASDELAELNRDGERIVSAAQAYHAGMTDTIITTGTSTDGIGDPSEIGRELLISMGVEPDCIFSISGMNTAQEMRALADFLQSPPEDWSSLVEDPSNPRVGLITSAFHMPRAMRLAADQGLDLLPIPCAFRGSQVERPWKASDWIPTAGNQDTLGLVIKETIAWMIGR